MNKTYKILIAEDEEINYMYLETLLFDMKCECKILHALDGNESIEFIKKDPEIDLILMDLRMSEMDGFKATELIKKINPTIPIVVQTAYISPNDKQKAKIAGCDDFISKPISEDTLRLILEKFLKINLGLA